MRTSECNQKFAIVCFDDKGQIMAAIHRKGFPYPITSNVNDYAYVAKELAEMKVDVLQPDYVQTWVAIPEAEFVCEINARRGY
jgi:hypothetical protein